MSNLVDLSSSKLHPRVGKKTLNRDWQEDMIQPNSESSFRVAWKALTLVFESVSKSTLSSCMSLNHWSALCKPKASPTSIEERHGSLRTFAKTNVPWESRTQMPILIWLRWEENATSTLCTCIYQAKVAANQ